MNTDPPGIEFSRQTRRPSEQGLKFNAERYRNANKSAPANRARRLHVYANLRRARLFRIHLRRPNMHEPARPARPHRIG